MIEKLKKYTLDDMNYKIEMLYNIKSTPEYKELEVLHNSTDELIRKQDISGSIKGRTNINSQISELMDSVKSELILCAPVIEIKRRLKLLEPIFKKLNDSHVKVTVALNGDDSEIKSISERFGIKAKKIDLKSSFYIMDKKDILFMLNDTDDSNEQIAAWFSSPFLAQSLASLFEMALKKK